jgi:hypothetical protein
LISDEVIELFQFAQSFQLHYGPVADSASNRNEYQKIFLGAKACSAHKAGNLTAIYEPIV